MDFLGLGGLGLATVIICDSFVVADWTDPGTHPGRPIAGLHLHRSDDEAWIVLTGTLGFQVDDERRQVAAGESILVTRGVRHSFWNATSEPYVAHLNRTRISVSSRSWITTKGWSSISNTRRF